MLRLNRKTVAKDLCVSLSIILQWIYLKLNENSRCKQICQLELLNFQVLTLHICKV